MKEVSLLCVVLTLISLSQKCTEPEAGSEAPGSEFMGFALMKNNKKVPPKPNSKLFNDSTGKNSRVVDVVVAVVDVIVNGGR